MCAWAQLGDRLRVAGALWMLAVVAFDQGERDDVRARCEESFAIFEEFGVDAGVAHVRLHARGPLAVRGRLRSRRSPLRLEPRSLQDLGDDHCVASTLRNLGVVALERSQPPDAVALLADSLEIRRRLDDRPGVAECLDGFARAAMALGQTERAVRLLAAAQVLREVSAPAARATVRLQGRRQQVAVIRAALGRDIFDDAWQAGAALTSEQAASEALAMRGGGRIPAGARDSSAPSPGARSIAASDASSPDLR